MRKSLKLEVNKFIKKHSLFNPDYTSLKKAAQNIGYTIVEFNNICNDKDIETIIKNLEISDNVLGDVIDVTDLYVAPSFIDPHVHMREPGFCESETIKTGSLAAARGGYTKVFLMPNTNPVISSIEAYQNLLEIIKRDSIIECFPLVSITKDEAGVELVDFEKFDCVGFSDDGKPVSNSYFVYQAMLKLKSLNKPMLCHC